jgi:hypothetical protein
MTVTYINKVGYNRVNIIPVLRNHSITMYGEMDVKFHTLISILDKGERSAASFCHFIPGERASGTHWKGYSKGTRYLLAFLKRNRRLQSVLTTNSRDCNKRFVPDDRANYLALVTSLSWSSWSTSAKVGMNVVPMESTPTPSFSFPTLNYSSMADELLRWIRATLDDTQTSFRIMNWCMVITLKNIIYFFGRR